MYHRDIDSDSTNEKFDYVNLSTWHTAFWLITAREWSGLDQWRMNKWMLLIRLAVRSIFSILFTAALSSDSDAKEVEALVDSQIKILEGRPLSLKERTVPDGLRLHVLDVWVDELEVAAGRELRVTVERELRVATEREPPATPGTKRRRGEDDDAEERDGEKKIGDKQQIGMKTKRPKSSKTSPADVITFASTEPATEPATKSEPVIKLKNRLMQPIFSLSKGALSKSVRIKASEVVKDYNESKIKHD
jgi:hypothetical protein